ncbi:TPA_asm: P3 [Chrysanthemum trirhavirus 1]|nr:TPA_asm: P3 [Chrysanthemum trirhavirus 1]
MIKSSQPQNPMGIMLQIEGSLEVLGKRRIKDDELNQLVDNLLSVPFANRITNKTIQELIIYSMSIFKTARLVSSKSTYEWGEDTIVTQVMWSGSLVSKVIGVLILEEHNIPVTRMIDIKSETFKVNLKLKVQLNPMSELDLARVIRNGSNPNVYPTLVVPDIIKRYREAHTRRANSEMMSPEPKAQKAV